MTTRTLSFPLLLLPLALLGACDSADDPATDSAEQGTETGEPEVDLDALYACEEQALTEFRPLVGPGWDPGLGLTDTSQDEYVVHTTQIYTRPETMETFIELANGVSMAADEVPGLIGVAIAGDEGCGVSRTLGVWTSTEAMLALVVTPAHAEAMSMTTALSYTGRVTHWTATRAELEAGLDWDDARDKLSTVQVSPLYD